MFFWVEAHNDGGERKTAILIQRLVGMVFYGLSKLSCTIYFCKLNVQIYKTDFFTRKEGRKEVFNFVAVSHLFNKMSRNKVYS